MKWYTCCTEASLPTFGELLTAAVHSCLARTSLVPHLLYDGRENAFTRHLESVGVRVVPHRVSFHDEILAAPPRHGFGAQVALGAYLRFDIPLVETEDDVVLYTDADVVFRSDPVLPGRPAILAAASEYRVDPVVELPHIFNSGVMLLNLAAWRALHPSLVATARSIRFFSEKGLGGHYDQAVLNMLFHAHRTPLPQALNWRPFAGPIDDPVVVHFHALKPFQVVELAAGGAGSPVRRGLWEGAREAYAFALAELARHRPPEALEALRRACPEARISTLT